MSVNTETSTHYKQASDLNDDGIMVSQTGDKEGHYGKVPVAQQAIGALLTTTGMNTGTSGLYSTTSLNTAFITAVAAIQTALKNLGLSS